MLMFSLKTIIIILISLSNNISCMEDYYKILGISRDADKRMIKKAFNSLSKKHHPDKKENKEDESHYTEIINAYETLKDPEKKSEYDQKLLYGENDDSYNLFHGSDSRRSQYSQNSEYNFYGKDGNFYTYSEKTRGYRNYRNSDQTFDVVGFLVSLLPNPKEFLWSLYEELKQALEIVYILFSCLVVVGLFLLNIFMKDVCAFLKTKEEN